MKYSWFQILELKWSTSVSSMLTFVDKPLSTISTQRYPYLFLQTESLLKAIFHPGDVGNKMIKAMNWLHTGRLSLFESTESPKMFVLLIFTVVVFKKMTSSQVLQYYFPSEFSQIKASFYCCCYISSLDYVTK